MGSMVEFPSNGSTGGGYFAPADGGGPGVVVIQEWWGLVPHITDVCDRFAAAGFSALAPDLYHGDSVPNTEPDEAGKLMMALNVGQAVKDLSGAVAFLQGSDAVTSNGVGVVGFCMGGGMALVLACANDGVTACAPFYGLIPWAHAEPDWSQLHAPVRGHYAENDGMFGPEAVAALKAKLDAAGKDSTFIIHDGCDHAFFNDTRPEVYTAAEAANAWDDTLAFFPRHHHVTDLVQRYVELGLRLGRHNPDIVDSYYGPPGWREHVAAEPVAEPSALVEEARRLIVDLDADATASDQQLETQRRVWLRSQTVGLHTVTRMLRGDAIDFIDEVELCFGVRPERIADDEVRDAQRELDRTLRGPGGGTEGSLEERTAALRARHVIPVDRLRAVIDNLADDLRERTKSIYGLPDGEHVTFDLVTDKPYSGFNLYHGDFHSLVTINTDLPVLSTSIAHLVAHEAYPGHHTEGCHKEAGLVRHRGRLEETIALIGTPSCLMAEGLADLGLEALVGSDTVGAVEPMIRDAGVTFEVDRVKAMEHFGEVMARARGTLAMQLHADGRPVDDVVATAKRWFVVDDARATQMVRFLTDKTWRAYVFCYAEGHRLCRAFVNGDPERFRRLLDEQLIPADLLGAA